MIIFCSIISFTTLRTSCILGSCWRFDHLRSLLGGDYPRVSPGEFVVVRCLSPLADLSGRTRRQRRSYSRDPVDAVEEVPGPRRRRRANSLRTSRQRDQRRWFARRSLVTADREQIEDASVHRREWSRSGNHLDLTRRTPLSTGEGDRAFRRTGKPARVVRDHPPTVPHRRSERHGSAAIAHRREDNRCVLGRPDPGNRVEASVRSPSRARRSSTTAVGTAGDVLYGLTRPGF